MSGNRPKLMLEVRNINARLNGAIRTGGIWLVSLFLAGLKFTFRHRIVTPDPRISIRNDGAGYILALLHAHQLAAVFHNDEPRLRTMVSRSRDGDLLIPLLRLGGIEPVRGSSRRNGVDKGGREALAGLTSGLREGIPALIAVDGPRGPRNTVHLGVGALAIQTGCPIICAVGVPTRRWIFGRTWDRFQFPIPFCRIDVSFSSRIDPRSDEDVEALCARVRSALDLLEESADPVEALRCRMLASHES